MLLDGGSKGIQMCPEFVKLTFNGTIINLWFKADRPLIDFLKADSASCNAVGWTMLQQALVAMETYWRETKLISRNPNLSFIFKKPGVKWDNNGLSFF